MVVGCPKCKKKLKVPDEKIRPEGTKFRCPGCSAVLVVKRPAAGEIKPLDPQKVLVGHGNPVSAAKMGKLLSAMGLRVIAVSDGVSAMVKAMEERPFLAFLDVILPKIPGTEVSRRLKARHETGQIKTVLVSPPLGGAVEPASAYGALDYLDEGRMEEALPLLMESLTGARPRPAALRPPPAAERPLQAAQRPLPAAERPPEKTPAKPPLKDDKVERAKRLSRAILSDIELYAVDKTKEAILKGGFREAFAKELGEGVKIYEAKIAAEVRNKGDFFNEEVANFIEKKKKSLGL